MSFSEYISPLVGRLLMAWFYLSEAVRYAGQWDATVQMLAMRHMAVPPLLLAVSLIVLILGGLSLIFGFQMRYGAVMLFGFTIVSSVALHNFWLLHNPIERAADFEIFARNIAIAGGLLLLVGMGPGPIAFDATGGKKR